MFSEMAEDKCQCYIINSPVQYCCNKLELVNVQGDKVKYADKTKMACFVARETAAIISDEAATISTQVIIFQHQQLVNVKVTDGTQCFNSQGRANRGDSLF